MDAGVVAAMPMPMPLRHRRAGAYGLCRDETGRVLLVRSSPNDLYPAGTWSLPGGGIEQAEHPQDTVRREYAEETGLQVDIAGLRDVSSDLAYLADREWVLHTDRVIYDVVVTGGQLVSEPDGTSDLARWWHPSDVDGLPLLPYVAAMLGLAVPVPEVPPSMAAAPRELVQVQRFSAYAVVTDPAGRVLLTRIAPGYPGAGQWHLPGGGTDFGEQPAAAVVREVGEETGQLVEVHELLDVQHTYNPAARGPEGRPLRWHTIRVVYLASVARPEVPAVAEVAGSTAEAGWFTAAELATCDLNRFARSMLAEQLRGGVTA